MKNFRVRSWRLLVSPSSLFLLASGIGFLACSPPSDSEGQRSSSPGLLEAARGLSEAEEGLAKANLQMLEGAALDVEATLGSMQDSGYRSYTPSGVSEELIAILNSGLVGLPGEPSIPGPQIEYVAFEAKEPWQVVLIPDDEAGVIHVEAFAGSLEAPAVTREVSVSEF